MSGVPLVCHLTKACVSNLFFVMASSRFRMRSAKFFLTWPQNDTPKEAVLGRIKEKFNDIKYAVVCEETHVDGSPHLHAILVLGSPLNVNQCDYFDDLTGKHGNYQTCRSPKKTLEYVIKDSQYVSFGIDVKSMLMKKGTDYSQAVELIQNGSSLIDVYRQFPGTYGKNLAALQNVVSARDALAGTPHQWDLTAERLLCLQMHSVGRWLSLNLCLPRPRRSKQLWIHGPPGVGKSALVEVLRRCCKVYTFPDEPQLEDWTDNIDLVVYDEPEAHKLKFMNKFLSGEVIRLPARYRTVVKTHNPGFIFLSNNTPEQVYHQASVPSSTSYPNFVAFLDRLEIIEVDTSFMKLVALLRKWYP